MGGLSACFINQTDFPWFSSVRLKSSSCQSRSLWRTMEWLSCMNHPKYPVSTLILPRIWWAESPICNCFLLVTTLPYLLSKPNNSDFPFGCADTVAVDRLYCSNVYEVNPWQWQFGRGKPHLGDLTVEQTATRKEDETCARNKRVAETKRHGKMAPA